MVPRIRPEQDETNIAEGGSGDNRKITYIQTEWPTMVHRLNLVESHVLREGHIKLEKTRKNPECCSRIEH